MFKVLHFSLVLFTDVIKAGEIRMGANGISFSFIKCTIVSTMPIITKLFNVY